MAALFSIGSAVQARLIGIVQSSDASSQAIAAFSCPPPYNYRGPSYSFDHAQGLLCELMEDGRVVQWDSGPAVENFDWVYGVSCPYGQSYNSAGVCISAPCAGDQTENAQSGLCETNPLAKQVGPSEPSTCRPIALGTGNKFLLEADYIGGGKSPLSMTRIYNSAASNRAKFDLANRWSSSLLRGISVDSVSSPTIAIVSRPEGKALRFTLDGGAWISDVDVADRLVQLRNGSTSSGWLYLATDDAIEEYDADGLLLRITARNGTILRFSSGGRLDGIRYGTIPKIAIAVLIAVAAIIFLVAYWGPKNAGPTELEACTAKCSKENRFARMVPAISNMPAKSGAYIGPWRCECY